jgi:predicted MPP superfamily phosphohydrolase
MTVSSHRGRRYPRTRQIALAMLDKALLRGLFAKWSYRCGLHGNLGVTQYEMQLPKESGLPAALVVAFASDFHAGPTTHPDLFASLSDELIRQRPDVLLLGGDYVSHRAQYVNVLVDFLSRCNPSLGKYAVLGNHDLWTDDTHITRQLTCAGVQVLVNENRPLPPPFDCVSICGIDDPWTGNARAAETFKGASAIRIFLTHSPDGLLLLDQESFHVGFAGHTHGGQIALPDGTPIVSAGGPLSRLYARGRFEIAGNGPLIVSRGVGCSQIPVRINSDPELIICTLRP